MTDWDPLAPGVERDPTEEHARLRQECPVAHSDRWGGFWTLFRYEDVVAAAKDTTTFISSQKATLPDSTPSRPPRPPLESDPPEHGGYRRLLNPYFSPGRLAAFEPQVAQLAGELLQKLVGGEHDAVAEFTSPYPAGVLCAFLGLPREDWTSLKSWAGEILAAARDGDQARLRDANQAIYDYVGNVVADRARHAGDPETDVLSGLLAAHEDGPRLTLDGVTGVIRLLLQAGHGTTTNAVGSAFRQLAEDPAEQRRLRAEPARIAGFVEEVLRLWSPARLLARTAARDVRIRDRDIRAGEKVALMFSSANRDEDVFPNAGVFDADRRPNRHLAFGRGIHTCLGAPLARIEVRIAVEELLRRTVWVEPAGPVTMAPWPHIGPEVLPLRFFAARKS